VARPGGLGRGLGALIPTGVVSNDEVGLQDIPLSSIRPNPQQPREHFDEESLAALAESIREVGVLQPVLVRPGGDGFELIAGERRWRAAQMAGLEQVPAIVREVPDEGALAMSLIENIQRENLNPMEEAAGLARLADEFKLTHQQVAEAVGRSRSATTNLLRLLGLAKPVQSMLMEHVLEMGHARALLGLDGARQIEAANKVAARGLSVRETEALVQGLLKGAGTVRGRHKRVDRDLARLEEELSESLGTSVEIKAGRKGSGKLVIRYSSLEHLEGLLAKLR
jgi:ParB family transcriptional regulator, chromosome partitioning protein